MWHTTEIIRIFEKITDEYGYDVYQNGKLCAALCNDLLVGYSVEKDILRMLFQAGLGDALKGVPFKNEQDLKMGLLRIEKFLTKQAIARETQDNVIEIIKMVFADKGICGTDYGMKPVVTKSFSGLHFKMTLPELVEYSDRLEFSFKYLYIKTAEEVDAILEQCVITDKFGDTHASHLDYTLLTHGRSRSVNICVAQEDRKVFVTRATVAFTFLCSNFQKISTVYSYDTNKKAALSEIQISRMTDSDHKRMMDLLSLLIKNAGNTGRMDDTQTDQVGMDSSAERMEVYTSSNITEYSEALHKEILFLKQGKGKRYKVVNGVKINRDDKGIYTYSFEMETELHLPDDAPVVVETSGGLRAVGTVLTCEDFQIMLLLDRDLNDKVGVAHLMVEPWKLLEALDKRMTSLNPNVNHLAVKLMEEGPDLATNQDIANVPKGQKNVVRKLNQEDIVTVWGPPGTGKTYTMAMIANDYLSQGKSVLIVSHSNVSVDGVVKRVISMADSNMQSWLESGKILRFGYVRDEELAANPYATSFNYALSQCTGLARTMEVLTDKRDELRARNQIKSKEYDEVERKIKQVRSEIRKEERKYVEKAKLIGTTISRATVDPMFEQRQFDLVMFDEVSMAYVPQVIAAAALAREKFLCVGDFRQLAPISQNPNANLLQVDIFAYLQIVDGMGKMFWHPWLVMLNEQRRMHPAISEFPNKYIYNRLLMDYPRLQHELDNIVESEPLSGDALNLIDMAGIYCAAEKNTDGSRYNILSAVVSFVTAVEAVQNGANSVGIITPYAAQTRLLRAMIRDYYSSENTKISCATVHQFQGSESEVVVFDAVESYPKNAVGYLMGKNPSQVARLINVAVTRSKGKLITVANQKFWENVFKGTNHILYRLLQHIKNGHTVISNREKSLKPYLESVNPKKMIHIFFDEQEAISQFGKDVDRAQGRMVISLPSGELRETEKQVFNLLDDADSRGIDILMKSNDYANLPDHWKEYCWGTENATFPLIVIDDTVAWYGIPTANWKFQVDKSNALVTVVHTMVRIKGKNTIEMIKTLTELEVVMVGANKRDLVSKRGNTVESKPILDNTDAGTLGAYGLAAFVEEKEFCPSCKHHMILVKNQKGTSYLRCSNKACKEMKFLPADLINWYISSKNVMCPKKDGGELKGGVGKYGPYVRCNCGHFLKPDEI